jgi:hypothetical protein
MSSQIEETTPPYTYFAPLAMKNYWGLDTELAIQNSGQSCTSISLAWMEYQTCNIQYSQDIATLAPGEAIRVRVPPVAELNGNELWLGSARISAGRPLDIILDETSLGSGQNRAVLKTTRVEPCDHGPRGLELYGPMIFREISGWSSTVSVQNLSPLSETWVTVKFLDASGSSVLSVSNWVCANGSLHFYLPAYTEQGLDYVGAVAIESLEREQHAPQPISAVVGLNKDIVYEPTIPGYRHTLPGEVQGFRYNAIPRSLVEGVNTIALPFLIKNETITSAISIRNNNNCNKLAATLDIYDGTGILASVPISIDPEEVEYVAMDFIGVPQFAGSGILRFSVDEILCGEEVPGAEVSMPSVVVVNRGTQADAGDTTSAYEGIALASPTPAD